MSRKAIFVSTEKTAAPYSPAVDSDGLIFLSGQLPVDPATGKIVEGGISAQTGQCFANAFALLAAAGLNEGNVQKVTVFLSDMANFAAMNQVYGGKFSEPFPARSAFAVSGLPMGALVEIEMIARR